MRFHAIRPFLGWLVPAFCLLSAACDGEPDPVGSGGSAGATGSGGGGADAPIQAPKGTSLLVRVIGAAGPVASAAVTVQGAQPRSTDAEGYVLFEQLYAGRFSARVEHPLFAPASAVAYLPQGAHADTEVRLLPLPARSTFDAATGAVLTKGAVRVTIPPDAVVDPNGEPFTGTVEATIVPFDPTVSLADAPGPLEGTEEGSEVVVGLESLFMAEVTLWSGSRRLQLAPGKKATLEMVLPDGVAARVLPGDSIPAWWFDLEDGLWREEGAGIVQASSEDPDELAWVVEVGHLSWWNCDEPWTDKHCFIVPVTSADGVTPVPGMLVSAEGMSYAGSSTPRVTDSAGEVCMDVKRDSTAVIRVGQSPYFFATHVVTGSGPASDCAGNGAACVELAPLPLPQDVLCTAGEWQDCYYSGPPGTAGVGICASAKRYCNAGGTAWSDCGGQVLPQDEGCESVLDDDCDGVANEGGVDCACAAGETATCYTGPSGTQGVGPCTPGTRMCDGGFFGPCLGQVTPQQETCATAGVDDDCDGTPECHGVPVWSERFGDAGEATVQSAAIDAAGNVVLTGFFDGTVDFGGGALTSAGAHDVFLAELDPEGNHLWSRRFGDAASQWAYSTAIDASGDVVLAGYFEGTLDFGGGPLTSAGAYDVFVAKLDADGNHLWSRRFGDGDDQFALSTAVDGAGNVVLAGFFGGAVELGGGPLTSAGAYDVFVAKLDAGGDHLWSRRFGDASYQRASAVAVDGSGAVLFTGWFDGTMEVGGGVLTSAGADDGFVAKLDADGSDVWSRQSGDIAVHPYAIAADAAGRVVLAGDFATEMDFGGGPTTGTGVYDIFVTKLDADGAHLWTHQYGDGNHQYAYAAAIDGAGNVVVAGSIDGEVDFGGGPLPDAGKLDVFALKLDGDGNHLWSRRFGDAGPQDGFAAAVDAAGNVVIAGSFEGTLAFGGTTLVSAGSRDAFAAKLTP